MTAAPEPKAALSDLVRIDDERDLLMIGPICVAGAVLRNIAPTAPGRWFRIASIEHGAIVIEEKMIRENKGEAGFAAEQTETDGFEPLFATPLSPKQEPRAGTVCDPAPPHYEQIKRGPL